MGGGEVVDWKGIPINLEYLDRVWLTQLWYFVPSLLYVSLWYLMRRRIYVV